MGAINIYIVIFPSSFPFSSLLLFLWTKHKKKWARSVGLADFVVVVVVALVNNWWDHLHVPEVAIVYGSFSGYFLSMKFIVKNISHLFPLLLSSIFRAKCCALIRLARYVCNFALAVFFTLLLCSVNSFISLFYTLVRVSILHPWSKPHHPRPEQTRRNLTERHGQRHTDSARRSICSDTPFLSMGKDKNKTLVSPPPLPHPHHRIASHWFGQCAVVASVTTIDEFLLSHLPLFFFPSFFSLSWPLILSPSPSKQWTMQA